MKSDSRHLLLKKLPNILRVAEITLRRWIKAGKIRFKRVGRNILFDPDELKVSKKNKQALKS